MNDVYYFNVPHVYQVIKAMTTVLWKWNSSTT